MGKGDFGKVFKTGADYAKDGQIIAGAVIAVIGAISKIVEVVDNRKKGQVAVPDLCDKNYPLTLTQATELLSDIGLNVSPYPLMRKYANVKYKDGFDYQVVGTSPEKGKRVASGSPVVVRYLTKEVIEESVILFERSELEKTKLKEKKDEERSKKKDLTRHRIFEATEKTKARINKVIPHGGKDNGGTID